MFRFVQNRSTHGSSPSCDLSFILKKLKNFSSDEYSTSDDNGMSVPPMACAFGKTYQAGNMLSMVDEDGYIVLYDVNKTGSAAVATTWQAHTNAVFDVSWAECDKQIMTASGDQTIALWEVEGHQKVDVFKGHASSVKSVSVRYGDEAVFASASRDGHIMIWDKRIYHTDGVVPPVDTIYNAHTLQQNITPGKARKKKAMVPKDGQHSVTAVVFQDYNNLVSCGAADGCIKLWDIRKTYKHFLTIAPTPVQVFHYPGSSLRRHGFSCLTFDANRTRLFASCTDDNIYEYNIKSAEDGPVHSFRGHRNSTFYVKTAISPDNQFLLSGSSDNHAYVWQINKREASPLLLKAHKAEVTSVAWCPTDLTKVVTLSDDAKTKFWRIYCREQKSSELPQWLGRARRLSKERSTSMIDTPPPFKRQMSQSVIPSPKQSPFGAKTQPTTKTSTPKSLHAWLKRKSEVDNSKGPSACKVLCQASKSTSAINSLSSLKRQRNLSNENKDFSDQASQCTLHNGDSNVCVPSKKRKLDCENSHPSLSATPDTPKRMTNCESIKLSSPRKLFKRSHESQNSPTKSPKRSCLTPVKDNGQPNEAVDRSTVKVSLFSHIESSKDKSSERQNSHIDQCTISHLETLENVSSDRVVKNDSHLSNGSSQHIESLTPLKEKLHQVLSEDGDHDSPTRNLPNLVMDQLTNLRPTSPSLTRSSRTKKLDWLTRLKMSKSKVVNESSVPVSPAGATKLSPKAYTILQDIEYQFYGGSVTQTVAQQYFVDSFTSAERLKLQDTFSQAYAMVSAKLEKYMSEEGQPGIGFLKQVQFFDPHKIILFPQNIEDLVKELNCLTELRQIPEWEFHKYITLYGPTAVKNAVTAVDVELFWNSMCSQLPALSASAKRYIFCTTASADAERSFSIYNSILTDKRRRLNTDNLRSLAFLCFNRFVGSDVFS